MDPTMLPRCLIPLMYGRALVMRCRAIAGCSQVATWGDDRLGSPAGASSSVNLEIVADTRGPPASRSTGWEGGGRALRCGVSGDLRAPVLQQAVVDLGVRQFARGRARVEEGRVPRLQ